MSNKDESQLDRIFKGLIFIGIFGLLDLIILRINGNSIFGYAGNAVRGILVGALGYAIYGYCFAGTVMGIFITLGMKPKVSLKIILNYLLILFVVICIAHLVTFKDYSTLSFNDYIMQAFNGQDSLGGAAFSWFLYPLAQLYVFSLVILSLILLGLIALAVINQLDFDIGIKFRDRTKHVGSVNNAQYYDISPSNDVNEDIPQPSYGPQLYNGDINGKLFSSSKLKTSRRNEDFEITPIDEVNPSGIMMGGMSDEDKEDIINSIPYSSDSDESEIKLAKQRMQEFANADKIIPINPIEEHVEPSRNDGLSPDGIIPFKPTAEDASFYNSNRKKTLDDNAAQGINHEFMEDYIPHANPAFDQTNTYKAPTFETPKKEEVDPFDAIINTISTEEVKPVETTPHFEPHYEAPKIEENGEVVEDQSEYLKPKNNDMLSFLQQKNEEKKQDSFKDLGISNYGAEKKEEKPIIKPAQPIKPVDPPKPVEPPKPKRIYKKYDAPNVANLKDTPMKELDRADMEARAEKLKEVLAAFNVDIEIVEIIMGPTFSRIVFKKDIKTPIKNITSRYDDIKLNMAVTSMRLLAPIPGTPYLGVEVPNKVRNMVPFKNVYLSSDYQKAIKKETGLVFAFGQDITGYNYSFDLTTAPHMLIAGATRSGKSVAINVMLASLLCRYSPEDLRLILFDPKQVEFAPYAGIPHLLIPEILNEPAKAMNAMNWAINEMERRYALLTNNSVRDLDSYNKLPEVMADKSLHIPYIVIVIDEFGEIANSQYKKDFDKLISRLAAKARAAGIHLVLATQRPSVDIITGTIKSNLPTRIALKCTATQDSMTILGEGGAEELLGYGDLLFMNPYEAELHRVQGAYLATEDLIEMIEYIKAHNDKFFDEDAEKMIMADPKQEEPEQMAMELGDVDKLDPAYIDALEACVAAQQVSTSFVQRKIGVGYPKAAKICDWIIDNGFAKTEGNKKIMVMTQAEFDAWKAAQDGDNQE